MRRTAAVRFLAAVVIASLVVSACGTAATQAPATAAPSAAPASAAPSAAPATAAPASSAPAASAAASPAASASAAASAAPSAAASAPAQSEGTIRLIGPEPSQGLDPAIAAADASRGPIDLMFDTLVAPQDETGELMGALAETVDVSADAQTDTFHRRPGMLYSDGSPITAEDEKFSIERMTAGEDI